MVFEQSIVDMVLDTALTAAGSDRRSSDLRSTPLRNSIKAQTKDLILQFPYLVSNSCSFDTIKPLARALENEYANLMMIKLSSEINIVKGNGTMDVQDVLKKYHTNYDNKGLSDYANDLLAMEATKFDLYKANKSLMEEYDLEYNSNILDEASYPTSIVYDEARKTKAQIQAELDQANADNERLQRGLDAANDARNRAEKRARDARNRADGIAARDTKARLQKAQANRDKAQAELDKEKIKAQANRDKAQAELDKEKIKAQAELDKEKRKAQAGLDIEKYKHDLQTKSDLYDYTAHIVRNDAKKLNEMNPTIVETILNFTAGNENFNKKVLFGVKGITHLLSNKDVTYYLGNSVKNRNAIFRLIQYTTGEIKLFRDLLFDIDRTKKLATASNGKSSFWWNKLHNVGKTSFIRKALNKIGTSINGSTYHDPIPTATMIVAMSDIDRIKYESNIDLFNQPKEVMRILNDFFLMSFIIVDEASEMYYVFNENEKGWDSYNKGQIRSFGEEEVKAGELKSRMF